MRRIADIQTAERNILQCQIEGHVAAHPGREYLLELEYGTDWGRLLRVYDCGAAAGNTLPAYRVKRLLGEADQARLRSAAALALKAQTAFALSAEGERGQVKILHTRFSYGGERLFIRYSAALPVDLRRFVNQLQRDFKTQVDLWQIGVRDQAALIGCLGPCGRKVCCCSWQNTVPSVNLKMAKDQGLSLSPLTVNGTCDKLKCCLRFEHDQYMELNRTLPSYGRLVRSKVDPRVKGMVIGRDLMRGLITVRTKAEQHLTVEADTLVYIINVEEDSQMEHDSEDSTD